MRIEASDYQEVKRHLLTAINILSPNGKVQKAFVSILHEMELAGEPPNAVIQSLVGTLYDGVAYGNWPGQTIKENHENLNWSEANQKQADDRMNRK